MFPLRIRGTTLPEFEVRVATVRSGTHAFRVQAADASAARTVVESDLCAGGGHCPAEWCTDDVQSEVVEVRAAVSTAFGASAPSSR